MKRDLAPRRPSAVGFRGWVRRNRPEIAVGSAVVVVAVFIALMLRGAGWLYGPGLSKLTPDQQVAAIDDVRGRMIQVATGLLAIGALVYTGLNFRLSREGHVTDRYTKAIEQLGSERLDVRLGAIYALERIMIDSPRDHPTIVEVLAAFVREHSPPAVKARGHNLVVVAAVEDPASPPAPVKPGTDVLAAMTVLGRRPSKREERGRLNLRSADATGADLAYADLVGVILTDACLTGADLIDANLTGAFLTSTDLTHAHLTGLEQQRNEQWRQRAEDPGLANARD